MAVVAAAALAYDTLKNGKDSIAHRSAAGAKENLALLVTWAKSDKPLAEKLRDIRAHFGRNFGKWTMVFLFVVLPLIQKYRNDPTWLKRFTPVYERTNGEKRVFESYQGAAEAAKSKTNFAMWSPVKENDKWYLRKKPTREEFLYSKHGNKAIKPTPVFSTIYFSRRFPVRSLINALSMPSAMVYNPGFPIRKWMKTPLYH